MKIRSSCANALAFVVALGSLFVPQEARAQQGDKNVIAVTEALMLTAYPDLPTDHVELMLYIDPPQLKSEWQRTSHLMLTLQHHHTVAKESREILNAEIWSPKGILDSASFSGPHVHTLRRQELRALVSEHPEWEIADITAAMDRLGARFGPNASEARSTLLRMIDQLGGLLGTVTSKRVEFVTREFEAVLLGWRGALDVMTAGSRICYALGFEPFDGRLTGIGRTKCE
jgi:hypothetical protein